MITISDALYALGIDGGWKIKEGQIVKWWADKPQPSDDAIQAKKTELQAEYEANQYQRDRASAYPSIQDQLDKIYHSGLTAWKADIKSIKDKYPKP